MTGSVGGGTEVGNNRFVAFVGPKTVYRNPNTLGYNHPLLGITTQ